MLKIEKLPKFTEKKIDFKLAKVFIIQKTFPIFIIQKAFSNILCMRFLIIIAYFDITEIFVLSNIEC